jgi:nitrite reductase/ring-hydroxylating ferredoxin subunit
MANWVKVAETENLAPGGRACATVENRPIAVFNIEGKLFAIADICPHAGMPLVEGDLAGRILTCPYHGYTFNLDTGKNIDDEDDVPLTMFPVRTTDDGEVQIDIDSPMEGTLNA